MLMNLNREQWTQGLVMKRFEDHQTSNEKTVEAMLKLSKEYNERVQEEEGKTMDELAVLNVGKVDPKRHLENDVSELMAANIVQSLGVMLDTVIF
ncbi:unnamed protein product [Ectocarpus sp. 8 AP-2014]